VNEVTGAGVVSLSVGSWHLILATEMQVYANLGPPMRKRKCFGGKAILPDLTLFLKTWNSTQQRRNYGRF